MLRPGIDDVENLGQSHSQKISQDKDFADEEARFEAVLWETVF